jgi:hypothetical protein
MRGRQSLQRTGCHEGPTILRPAPCRNPRPSPPSFPGWARRSAGECRACAMGAGGAFKSAKKGRHRRLEGCLVSPRTADLHIGAGGQGRTVREQRSNRDAMAAPRAAWESVPGTTEMRWRSAGRRGWESVHGTTLATLDEQSGRRVGPTILFDPPRPPLLTSFFSLWAYS